MAGSSSGLGPLIIDIDGGLSLSGADRARLLSPLVGGVILFSRNFADRSQLCALTREIKSLRAPELLITVDQEGGRVQRFRDGFTRLPPAAACGSLYDASPREGERLAGDIGRVMAAELVECGVDLSFAPVLDVLSRDSRVIGDRAFHADPGAVCRLASAYIEGMHAAGMRCVGKHFPGHGGVGEDSHACLPEDPRSLDALRRCDLQPYVSLSPKLQGVMLAHVRYGAIDASIPSYSAFWIGEVLRGELGFGGAVFSDDLSMAGAGEASLPERCTAALRAGCDLLPVCNDTAGVDRLLDALEGEDIAARDELIATLYASPAAIQPQLLTAARENLARAPAA
ncbi:MAG TPA: beta-N-acetylhexosaminidase [Arenicellales bacterium]|nr:beta-N-acetylhexosaminidase [Arenicellales bacterium]